MLRKVPKPSSNQLAVWRQLQWATALIMRDYRVNWPTPDSRSNSSMCLFTWHGHHKALSHSRS